MILSRERYNELRTFLLELTQTQLRTITIEDSLEWDLPLDTLQSIFAQVMKRYVQTVMDSILYKSDVMKRVMMNYIDTIKIEENTPPSSSSTPQNRLRQIYSFLNGVLHDTSTYQPPSLARSGGRSDRIKSSPVSSPPSPPPPVQYDVKKIHDDLLRLITLCPYNLANLYLKMKITKDPKISVAKFLIQPEAIIPNPIARYNLFYLIGHDVLNAPDIDLMKEHVGKEYEEMLEQLLKNRYMEFETEEDSRRKGRQKTPDILFTIPMAVRLPPMYHSARQRYRRNLVQYHDVNDYGFQTMSINTTSDFSTYDQRRSNRSESFDLCNHFPSEENLVQTSASNQQRDQSDSSLSNTVPLSPRPNIDRLQLSHPRDETQSSDGTYLIVNWIDSKALFADLETFEEHMDQFRMYTNRFGRGMVIYWQGFCEDILDHAGLSMNDDILVCDQFPDDWLFPTGEPADGRRPFFDGIALPIPPDKVP